MLSESRSASAVGLMNSILGTRRSCSLFPWVVGISVSLKGRKIGISGRSDVMDEPGVEKDTKCSCDLKPCKETSIWYLVR